MERRWFRNDVKTLPYIRETQYKEQATTAKSDRTQNHMLRFGHEVEKEKALLLSLLVKLRLAKSLPDSLVTLVNWRLLDCKVKTPDETR